MYGTAITYGVVSLLFLGGFANITFKTISKKLKKVVKLHHKLRIDNSS